MSDIIFFNSNPGGGGGSGVLTLNNGLTKTGTTGQLGGPLVQDTDIQLSGFAFQIAGATATFQIAADGSIVLQYDDGAGNGSSIVLNLSTAQIGFNAGVNNSTILFNAIHALVTDSVNNQGLINAGDYEANFIARSLVTKQYVDGAITGVGVQTLSNGLTKTGTVGKLGGPLTADTTITITGFLLKLLAVGGTVTPTFSLNNNQVLIGLVKAANVLNIIISNTGAVVTDTVNSKGLENAGDYEANFTARSLVTKQYIDDNGVQTLNNGLTKTGTNGQLGGVLTQDTIIESTAHDFTVTSTTNAKAALVVSKSNTGTLALQVEGLTQMNGNLHVTEILSIENGAGGGAVNFSPENYIQFINTESIRVKATEYIASNTFAVDFHNIGTNEHLYFYRTDIYNSLGFKFLTTGGGDIVGKTTLSVAPVDPTDLVRLQDLTGGGSGVVSSIAVQAQTGSGTLVTYPIPGSSGNSVFNINYFAIVRSIAGGSATISIDYTDSTGTARTFNVPALLGTGPGDFSPLTISCTNGTNIVTTYTVTGTINFDIGQAIQLLF